MPIAAHFHIHPGVRAAVIDGFHDLGAAVAAVAYWPVFTFSLVSSGLILAAVTPDQVAAWLGTLTLIVPSVLGVLYVVLAGRTKVEREQRDKEKEEYDFHVDVMKRSYEQQLMVLKATIEFQDTEIRRLQTMLRERTGGGPGAPQVPGAPGSPGVTPP